MTVSTLLITPKEQIEDALRVAVHHMICEHVIQECRAERELSFADLEELKGRVAEIYEGLR